MCLYAAFDISRQAKLNGREYRSAVLGNEGVDGFRTG